MWNTATPQAVQYSGQESQVHLHGGVGGVHRPSHRRDWLAHHDQQTATRQDLVLGKYFCMYAREVCPTEIAT